MVRKILKVSYDILRGVNATIWGGAKGAEKTSKIIKTGTSIADVCIGSSHAIEDFGCNDKFCGTLDVIGSISSALGLVLGNIPATKQCTSVTGSITVGCRLIRYYCKTYGTVWGCAISIGEGVYHGGKEVVKKTKIFIPKAAEIVKNAEVLKN